MVIQITTEAVGRYGPAEQMATVRAVHPEAVSLGLMELIPDDQGIDAAPAFLAWLQGERIAPQYILYSPSEVARLHDLRRSGVIPQRRPFALFVLGRYGDQTEAQPRDVLPFLAAHHADCPWAVCAFGPREGACVLTAAGLGGHVRVGFENNLRSADGRLATSNAELAARNGRRPAARPRGRRHRNHPRVPCRDGGLAACPSRQKQTAERCGCAGCCGDQAASAGGITLSSTIWLRWRRNTSKRKPWKAKLCPTSGMRRAS
jgi:hypothetical protein